MVCEHPAVNYSERGTALVAGADCGAVAARSALTIRMRAERTNERMGLVADTLVRTALSKATRATNPSLVAFLRECIMRQSVEGYARTCEALAGLCLRI
jgi:3-oxoadipate enol-lactonase